MNLISRFVGKFDGEISRSVEQEISVGRIGHEVFVGIEARLLGHIDAREESEATYCLRRPKVLL